MTSLTYICISYGVNVSDNFCGTFGTFFLAGFLLDVVHLSHPYLRDISLLLQVRLNMLRRYVKAKALRLSTIYVL